MEKFLEALSAAEKNLQTVDHMVYITFPLIKDKRLLLKVMRDVKTIISTCINIILQHEYLYKRIRLFQDSRENFRTFTEKSSGRYGIIRDEIKTIRELFDFVERHKTSPFEFIKDEKVIILSENMKPAALSLEKTKEFLNLAKEILKKTKQGIKRQI